MIGVCAAGLLASVIWTAEAVAEESLSEPVAAAAQRPAVDPAPTDDAQPTTVDSGAGTAPPPEAAVQLDQLLRLPNSLDFREERKGGAGASDWRRRFRESEENIHKAKAKVDEVETELDSAADGGSGQWQIAPPGQNASSDTGPLSFRLREELRRARADFDEAERQHRALIVEADLAGVPQAWRGQTP